MPIDIADATVVAEIEVETNAFRRRLKAWLPVLKRIAAPDELGGYAAVRDDLGVCLESVDSVLESIGDAPVVVA